jgi:hypothetical protein
VAGRNSVGLLSGAALAEPSSYFSRRIRILLDKRKNGWSAHASGFALVAFLPLGGALFLPPPVGMEGEEIAAPGSTHFPEGAATPEGSLENASEVPPIEIEGDQADFAQEGSRMNRLGSVDAPIVETLSPPSETSPRGWVVESTPILSIRSEEDGLYRFERIRLVSRNRQGVLVVNEDENRELGFLTFAPDGSLLQSAGRGVSASGDRSLWNPQYEVRRCGEGRIYAWNRWNRRMEVWDEDGILLQEFDFLEPGSGNPLPPRDPASQNWVVPAGTGRTPYRWACSLDGDFVAGGWGDTSGLTARAGVHAQRAPVWVMDSNGDVTAELGEHFQGDRVTVPSTQNPSAGTNGPHPLGRQTRIATKDGRVYVGTSERMEVLVYDRAGELQEILRGPEEDLSINPGLLGLLRETTEEGVDTRFIDRIIAGNFPLPEGLPAFTELLLDSDDYLWARRFRHPLESSERWGIFDPEGAFLGHVILQPGFVLREVGTDYLLGTEPGEDGRELVQMYALRRG